MYVITAKINSSSYEFELTVPVDGRGPEWNVARLCNPVPLLCPFTGLKGTYQGLTATVLKQGSNQAIRFFVMTSLRNWYKGQYLPLARGAYAGRRLLILSSQKNVRLFSNQATTLTSP